MLQENTIIDNHYELKRQLGRGSFGEVWLAIDTYLQQEVALKFYVAMDDNGRSEFRDEYRKVFRLRHENLLTPSHYAEWNGQPYLELEYCPASAAAQLGKLNEQQLWCFIADVAAGLACMHGSNPTLVHQDIKPANILQKTDGHYAITDFGISVSLRSTMLRQSGHEVSGSVGGSIPYMGPELFGAKPVPVMASDIWALGVTIYEMATGTLPFMGQGGIMLKNGAELPILEDYSHELNNLMQSCLALNTWDRPTAEKVAEQATQHCNGYNPKQPIEQKQLQASGSETQVMPNEEKSQPYKKPQTIGQKLTVQPTNILLDANGKDVQVVFVDSSAEWIANSGAEWLIVTKANNSKLEIKAEKNPKFTRRTSYITISAGKKACRIDCVQRKTNKVTRGLIAFCVSSLIVGFLWGGTIRKDNYNKSINNFHNTIRQATPYDTSPIPKAQNIIYELKRLEKGLFSYMVDSESDELQKKLNKRRKQVAPQIELNCHKITDTEGEGGVVEIKITANVENLTVQSDQTWCKIDNCTGNSFRVTLDVNKTGGVRNATITVKGDFEQSQTVAVTQKKRVANKPNMKVTIGKREDEIRNREFEMVFVEGGTFIMGAGTSNAHKVTLSSYYIGKYEVTNDVWRAIMDYDNISVIKYENAEPVINVSWDDCQEFIRKLNNNTSKNFRLPTEAEWEFAAHGGNKSNGYKYAGSNVLTKVANTYTIEQYRQYSDFSLDYYHKHPSFGGLRLTEEDRAWDDRISKSSMIKAARKKGIPVVELQTVGSKSPNELGIYDMSGNVNEWCYDLYAEYSGHSEINPQGASSGSQRVVRGGDVICTKKACEVTYRNKEEQNYKGLVKFDNIGFRLCLPANNLILE